MIVLIVVRILRVTVGVLSVVIVTLVVMQASSVSVVVVNDLVFTTMLAATTVAKQTPDLLESLEKDHLEPRRRSMNDMNHIMIHMTHES